MWVLVCILVLHAEAGFSVTTKEHPMPNQTECEYELKRIEIMLTEMILETEDRLTFSLTCEYR